MRILVIGPHGTIGREIVKALDGHEIIGAARNDADLPVDITDPNSIVTMYAQLGRVDAVVCAAGAGAWKPLDQLSGEDFEASLHYKLMGQVNVVRYGLANVNDGGSITVTSGVLARSPMVGSAAISLVNAGLEGFVRAAARRARERRQPTLGHGDTPRDGRHRHVARPPRRDGGQGVRAQRDGPRNRPGHRTLGTPPSRRLSTRRPAAEGGGGGTPRAQPAGTPAFR